MDFVASIVGPDAFYVYLNAAYTVSGLLGRPSLFGSLDEPLLPFCPNLIPIMLGAHLVVNPCVGASRWIDRGHVDTAISTCDSVALHLSQRDKLLNNRHPLAHIQKTHLPMYSCHTSQSIMTPRAKFNGSTTLLRASHLFADDFSSSRLVVWRAMLPPTKTKTEN